MSEEVAIDHLRTWIGRQQRVSDIITPELLQRFRATLGTYSVYDTELNPPETSSRTSPASSQPPYGIHWCLAQPAVTADGLGADGHPAKGGFLPPVPLPRRMWASGRTRFYQTPSIGNAIERTSTIADVVLKQSAASGPLVFVHIDHLYTETTAQEKETLIEERQTLVYRQAAQFRQAKPSQPGEQPAIPAFSLKLLPDSTLLFRYSAMTFNGHRIHYDHHYATGEEGYPGLVVHGPLMATLLMHLAQASRPERPLREFEFRGIAPAFVDQTLVFSVTGIGAARNQASESLEVRNHEGALIMTANAEFGDDNAD